MIIELKKLYPHQGFLTARARDYQVSKCIEMKQDLHFKFRNRIMTIPLTRLQALIVEESEPMQSMYNPDQTYKTVGYVWKPEPILSEEEQLKEFSKQCL